VKRTIVELLGATLYAFGITPWVYIVCSFFGLWWALGLVAVTLFLYYLVIKWIEEELSGF